MIRRTHPLDTYFNCTESSKYAPLMRSFQLFIFHLASVSVCVYVKEFSSVSVFISEHILSIWSKLHFLSYKKWKDFPFSLVQIHWDVFSKHDTHFLFKHFKQKASFSHTFAERPTFLDFLYGSLIRMQIKKQYWVFSRKTIVPPDNIFSVRWG